MVVDSSLPSPAVVAAFLEGPAATANGDVYFSDIINNRILRFDSARNRFETFRQPSGRANGLLFDHLGRLLACEGNEFSPDDDGNRRLTRTDIRTGHVEVLCDNWNGRRLNSPNDVAANSSGHIWFTDPCYSERQRMQLDHESIYHIDPDGKVEIAISQPQIQRPNGIHLSPDEKMLYVIDSCSVVGGNRKVWAFELDGQLRPVSQRLVYDFGGGRGGDGMAVDQNGILHVAAGILHARGPHESGAVQPGIYRISPAGELLGRIPIPEDTITNVTFGGPDLKTLYITAGKTLYSAASPVPGWVVHRNAKN